MFSFQPAHGRIGQNLKYAVKEAEEQMLSETRKKSIREWMLITAGVLILTAGVYFFKFPNHFSTGGVTGIAIEYDMCGHEFDAADEIKSPAKNLWTGQK